MPAGTCDLAEDHVAPTDGRRSAGQRHRQDLRRMNAESQGSQERALGQEHYHDSESGLGLWEAARQGNPRGAAGSAGAAARGRAD